MVPQLCLAGWAKLTTQCFALFIKCGRGVLAELVLFQESLGTTAADLLLALLIEPLLQLIGVVALATIAFYHYQKTRNQGALLIVIALICSVVSSVAIELGAAFIEGAGYEQVTLCLRLVDGILLLTFILGFYLICRSQRAAS
jgi:hypothetical protein